MIQWLSQLVEPRSVGEDQRRREYIVNVFLLGSVLLVLAGGVAFLTQTWLNSEEFSLTNLGVLLIALGLFLGLYTLNRAGHTVLAPYLLITVYVYLTFTTLHRWGADTPQALLACTLIIIMAGVMISTAAAFLSTVLISFYLIFLTYAQVTGRVVVDASWKTNKGLEMGDTLIFVGTLLIILSVSWLANREIERSLRRARISEEQLLEEREVLEKRVEERTQALKEAQLETLSHVYRFAEFGKLASGIFHDLANPLAAVSLNLEQLNALSVKEMRQTYRYLTEATRATRRMERFIYAIKHQLQRQEVNSLFSPKEEIRQSMQILTYRARKLNLTIHLEAASTIELYGNPLKFNQIITNLLSNALDAYEGMSPNHRKRTIDISLKSQKDAVLMTVRDWGVGIDPDNLPKLFEPFFTTKPMDKGVGIGLSIVQDIVEQDFKGEIWATSSKKEGTVFSVRLPLQKNMA